MSAFCKTSMFKTSLLKTSAAAAFALTVGFAVTSAEAGVATPATAAATPTVALTENVHWVCGPFRCVWRPNYPAWWYVPTYARAWAPPPRAECYWSRGPWPNGTWGWRQVCP